MRCVKGKVAPEDRRMETPSIHGVGRNTSAGAENKRGIGVDQLLIVEIEEQLVLDDWPTDGAAEVIVTLLRFGAGPVEVVSCIQVVVLEIIVQGAVKLTGPALADDVEDVAAAAVHRRGGRSNHVHFSDVLALTLINVGAVRQPNRTTVNQIAREVGQDSKDT